MSIDQAENWQIQVKVSECEQLVITYETLARQIAHLLLINGGVTRTMSDEAFANYRQLAMRRDVVCHMIQVMEYTLSNE